MIQEKEKQSQAETQEQGENWMQIAFAAQSENEGFAGKPSAAGFFLRALAFEAAAFFFTGAPNSLI